MSSFFLDTLTTTKKRIIKNCLKMKSALILFFLPHKFGSMFSTKDKIPFFLRSMVVYKFVCASGNVCYLGQTDRHLPATTKDHLKTDKTWYVYQHLSSHENCFNSCTDDCFSLLDYASTKYQLNVKEAL